MVVKILKQLYLEFLNCINLLLFIARLVLDFIKKNIDDMKFIKTIVLIAICVALFISVILLTTFVNPEMLTKDDKVRDQFLIDGANLGQAFGILSAWFAGIAVILVYINLKEQKKELTLTRLHYEEQQNTSAFYEMLNLLNTLISDMQVHSPEKKRDFNGRRAFGVFHYDLGRNFPGEITEGFSDEDHLRVLKKKWEDFYTEKEHRAWLPHYFRALYRLVKYIDETQFSSDRDKNMAIRCKLAKALRSQLSDYELALLFYNLQAKRGENFIKLCQTYNLLKHLEEDMLFRVPHKKIFRAFQAESKNNKIC